jgi:hypothetical protein
MPGGRKLPHKREEAIAALIQLGSAEKAAARCGVSERTLRNWLNDPAFPADYRQARRDLIDEAVRELQLATQAAVTTLVKLLQSDKPAVALRAAQLILDQSFRGAELLDLAEAVKDLHRQVREVQNGAGEFGTRGGPPAGGPAPPEPG